MRAAFLAVAILFAAGPDMSGAAGLESYWQQRGCDHGHRSPVAGHRITAIMRSIDPLTKARYRRVWHYVVCTNERAGHLKLRARLVELRRWRREHRDWIREQRQWAYIRAHPMPWCTWGQESGASLPEYHPARYTARNPSSTAGGKYQILDGTWWANGGGRYADSHPAAVAPPLEQEHVARNVLRSQGLGAWVNC